MTVIYLQFFKVISAIFGGTDDLCKLGKEYLIALTCKLYISLYRQNSETFDILQAFLSSVVAKLCDLKNSPVFWPTLYTPTF